METETKPDESMSHLDGFRVVPESDEEWLKVSVRLVVGGTHRPDLFQDLQIFGAPRNWRSEAEQDRALILGQALCTFMNAGGKKDDLFLLVDHFVSKVSDLRPVNALMSVLPPPGGPVFIWKRPDGTYLKVQEGDDGFTETLTENERLELLGQEAKEPPDSSDWP